MNPDDPDIIVGGFIEFRARKCGLVRSTDAGKTWKILESTPEIKSQPYCLANNSNIFHAPVAWGRNNALYLATHAWDETTRTQTSVIVAKSTDLGDTWETVFARDARTTSGDDQENDRPVTGFVVDPKSGSQDIVYVMYRRAVANRVAPERRPQEAAISISRDGGKTFEEPVERHRQRLRGRRRSVSWASPAAPRSTLAPGATTTVPPAGSQAANPTDIRNFGVSSNGQGLTLDNKGNLYVTYMSEIANVSGAPRAIMVSKSTDKGKTWTTTMAVPFSYEQAQNVRAWPGRRAAGPTARCTSCGSGATRPPSPGTPMSATSAPPTAARPGASPSSIADDDPKS